jgi:hypothetical protein
LGLGIGRRASCSRRVRVRVGVRVGVRDRPQSELLEAC